jgi:integrase
MYYDNPITGKREWRSTECTKRADANAKAGEWEADIRANRYRPDSNITWSDFRELFLDEHLGAAPKKTRAAYVCAFNALERHVKIGRLAELTAERIKHATSELRKEKLSAESVRSYLRHVKAALPWALERELLRREVKITTGKRQKGQRFMKGRPITTEEFERMLAKIEAGLVAANVRKGTPEERREKLAKKAKEIAPDWKAFLEALWWGGLRLGEALTLSWDDERFITVDLSGEHPRLRIEAGQDKSQAERLLPLAPEFAKILLARPSDDRKGNVLPLRGLSGDAVRGVEYASAVIAKIGELAGIKVKTDASGKVKFASAHDLRRAFGARWAMRVMPAVLQKMMRHADIQTTMRFYAYLDAKSVEQAIYGTKPAEPNKVGDKVDATPSK